MDGWTSDELARIGSAEEARIAVRRPDGSLRKPVIVRVVRCGDRLYVRSVYGPDGAWFQATRACPEGRLQTDGLDKDVVFVDADHDIDDEVDAAYGSKYRGEEEDVRLITTPSARSTTMTLRVAQR